MKELAGYLIARDTGIGIAGKAVTYKNLAGTAISTATTYAQVVDAVTDANGRFSGKFELSPGPVQVEVTVSGSEKKERKWDEKSQIGHVWNSDLGSAFRAIKEGVLAGYLNELAVSIPSGHTIRIATGAANINGNMFSIEFGNLDVTGTANGNAALNPRLDLVTLRQYNSDAPGQDAGRQEVVVTLGTTQNVEPALPVGATFKDFPLAVVSTAFGATTKTVSRDARSFTGNITPEVPHTASVTVSTPVTLTNASYTTVGTLTITGLNPANTYDGEVFFSGMMEFENMGNNVFDDIKIKMFKPQIDGGLINGIIIAQGYFHIAGSSGNWNINLPISQSSPIIGVTGVSSYAIPVELQSGAVGGGITIFQWGRLRAVLRKRV